MKKVILSMFVAMMATVAAQAQQIAVVSGGSTNLYRTLQEAIDGALSGSVIYLPGGGIPASDINIDKKITIIGIGHKQKGVNADGYTSIGGNINFKKGSDGSAIIGCYISGNVNIADNSDTGAVNDILVQFCNLNSIQVFDQDCDGIEVNQNYIRGTSNFDYTNPTITNNVLGALRYLNTAVVSNNIFINGVYTNKSGYQNGYYGFLDVKNTSFSENVFMCNVRFDNQTTNDNCQAIGNMTSASWPFGDEAILVSDSWSMVFKNNAGITPSSEFYFTEKYKEYEGKCGLYGGTSFDDDALPPVPCIIKKEVNPQTDTSGMLKVTISVKAAE